MTQFLDNLTIEGLLQYDLVATLEPNPTTWVETPTYLSSGEFDYIEWTNAGVRKLRVDFTYNASSDPVTEVWKFYDTGGSTVLRTVTKTYAYSGFDITSVTSVYT